MVDKGIKVGDKITYNGTPWKVLSIINGMVELKCIPCPNRVKKVSIDKL